MHDTINGAMFKEMLLFGTVSIAQAQQAINDLNVFPVPDGDTGTNMSLTIQTAAQELKKIEPATVDQPPLSRRPRCCAARAATPASFCRFSSAASPRSSRAAKRPTARRLPPRFRRVSPRRITP